jgi:hypothetical protein
MRWFAGLIAVLAPCSVAPAATFKTDHVIVNYDGVTEAQAASLGRVAEASRLAASERYGFDVPATITVNVSCKPDNKVALFTDGNDTYTLRVRTHADLAPPAQSGVFNLYGMCHELGHVVMYRVIREHNWMTVDALEGWAHYIGSRLVDDVYAAEGQRAWWTPYDYRAEGIKRLDEQLIAPGADGMARAAGLWKELHAIVGEKGMGKLFATLGKTKVDANDPAVAVKPTVLGASDDPKLAVWWEKASLLLLKVTPRSKFAATTTAPAGKLAGATKELAADDGKSAGRSSMAGGGHAVVFDVPEGGGGPWHLTSVKIFGSRYGDVQPPAEDFHVYLCDADGKQIADLAFPYKLFLRGGAKWTTLKLKEPLAFPAGAEKVMLLVAFNPTARKGVFVHYDAVPDGDSRSGLPGNASEPFAKGDWMIRGAVQQGG